MWLRMREMRIVPMVVRRRNERMKVTALTREGHRPLSKSGLFPISNSSSSWAERAELLIFEVILQKCWSARLR